MRALIADDEAPARRRLRGVLQQLSRISAIDECATGREALQRLGSGRFDILFLDMEMPDLHGLTVASDLGRRREVALVIVTAHERFAARAFDVEAVDYVLKPFDDERLAESVRRAAQWLGFVRSGPPAVDRFGDIEVHYASHLVTRGPNAIALRPKEYELLLALLRRGGAIATRAELLREVFGYSGSVMSRTVDTHVRALRRRLERDPAKPRFILTVRHYGYRLDREAAS